MHCCALRVGRCAHLDGTQTTKKWQNPWIPGFQIISIWPQLPAIFCPSSPHWNMFGLSGCPVLFSWTFKAKKFFYHFSKIVGNERKLPDLKYIPWVRYGPPWSGARRAPNGSIYLPFFLSFIWIFFIPLNLFYGYSYLVFVYCSFNFVFDYCNVSCISYIEIINFCAGIGPITEPLIFIDHHYCSFPTKCSAVLQFSSKMGKKNAKLFGKKRTTSGGESWVPGSLQFPTLILPWSGPQGPFGLRAILKGQSLVRKKNPSRVDHPSKTVLTSGGWNILPFYHFDAKKNQKQNAAKMT